MMRTYALSLLATCLALPAAAAAQNNASAPKQSYYIGDGEVDLYRGTFMYSNTDLTVGPPEPEGGLSFSRFYGVRANNGWGHNLEIAVYRDSYKEEGSWQGELSYTYHVVIGRKVITFDESAGGPGVPSTYTATDYRDGTTLKRTGVDGPYIYTARDGTAINFETLNNYCPAMGFPTVRCGVATSIVRPDGSATNLHYETIDTWPQEDITAWGPRLRFVTTSEGFGLGLEYMEASGRRISRVCAMNLALARPVLQMPCPVSTATVSYGYSDGSARISSYVDASGKAAAYGYNGSNLSTIRNPGSATDDLTVAYSPTTYKVESLTYANGAGWTYAYEHQYPSDDPNYGLDVVGNGWTEVTSPLQHPVRHYFVAEARPGAVKDPNGHYTYFRFWNDELQRKTEHEGNYVHNTYDARANLTEKRAVSKAGPGADDIVATALYPATCGNWKICNKPESTTDARGNVTTYTYDATHGGVLTETLPAVTSGSNQVQPQKRYVYAQKNGGKKNEYGAIVPGDPVWVLTEEKMCLTGATTGNCNVANDEARTVYDWGTPMHGPLLLRGKVVDPDGLNLRTCYTYDARGNRISETEPKGGLTSCP